MPGVPVLASHPAAAPCLLPAPSVCALSAQQQSGLLAGVRRVLEGSAFRFQAPWARIISGADEGVYGWVALNYLQGGWVCCLVLGGVAQGGVVLGWDMRGVS